jgi:hypothetical protein
VPPSAAVGGGVGQQLDRYRTPANLHRPGVKRAHAQRSTAPVPQRTLQGLPLGAPNRRCKMCRRWSTQAQGLAPRAAATLDAWFGANNWGERALRGL